MEHFIGSIRKVLFSLNLLLLRTSLFLWYFVLFQYHVKQVKCHLDTISPVMNSLLLLKTRITRNKQCCIFFIPLLTQNLTLTIIRNNLYQECNLNMITMVKNIFFKQMCVLLQGTVYGTHLFVVMSIHLYIYSSYIDVNIYTMLRFLSCIVKTTQHLVI